ncbi:MAG: acetyl-CoA hydrolase/transferase C-terminal domain-containing protein [Brevefilum sp.]
MTDRIPASLKNQIVSYAKAAEPIKDGMTVAMSGYAMAGYPKAIPGELVRRKNKGQKLTINLVTGANVPWLDELLGASEIIAGRAPMCASKVLSAQANSGKVRYVEQQMCKMPRLLRSQSFGEIDVLVVEALAVTEEGLIPTTSVGLTHFLMEAAHEIIIEVNRAQPETLFGLHDVYIQKPPPATEPIPLISCNDRVGSSFIPVDKSKIKYIVETDTPENIEENPTFSGNSEKIAENLINFLRAEYHTSSGGSIPPIQLGFGNIANAIADTLQSSEFYHLQFHCGGVSEKVLQLLLSGKASGVSTSGISMNPNVGKILEQVPDIQKKLILRNGDIINNSEIIGRLALLALNTGIEIDIYGNVNSSHIAGTRVVYGIGGGANFAQNAGLSVVLIPSVSKGGAISNIVPMVSHQDICEHDIDIVITENGCADVRGLDDLQRAEAIISNCAAEDYKQQLFNYFGASKKFGGHHPQNPHMAFAWYTRLKETGTMHE